VSCPLTGWCRAISKYKRVLHKHKEKTLIIAKGLEGEAKYLEARKLEL
jgi:hypothetical protein